MNGERYLSSAAIGHTGDSPKRETDTVAMSFLFCSVLDHLFNSRAPAKVHIISALANCLV